MPIGTFLYCGKLDGYRLVSKTLDKTLGGRDGKLFPRGKHLTNPAAPRGAGQLSRQPSQRCDQNYIIIMKLHLGLDTRVRGLGRK